MPRYVCRTTSPDGLPDFAIVSLDRFFVRDLLARCELFDATKKQDRNLTCMEFESYGLVTYLDNLGDAEEDWVELEDALNDAERDPNPREGFPGYTEVPTKLKTPPGVDKTTLERLVVMQDELYWCTNLKHCDGTAETKTISRQSLRRWLMQNKD